MPHLHIFPISHFSEKARWALDHHGIGYERTDHVPGFHLLMIRRLGLKRTWVPVLETDAGVVQGSGDIIDWADANGQGAALTPTDAVKVGASGMRSAPSGASSMAPWMSA